MKYEGKIYGKVAGKYIQLDVNPNLVDAAPDLLAALKLAVNQYENEYQISVDSYRAFYGIEPNFKSQEWEMPEWVRQAKSAIEKAEKI
jgi:hypothetical protein